MIKRTISGMIGKGSLAHNRREFFAENVDPDRVQLNICYQNENLKEVYICLDGQGICFNKEEGKRVSNIDCRR